MPQQPGRVVHSPADIGTAMRDALGAKASA